MRLVPLRLCLLGALGLVNACMVNTQHATPGCVVHGSGPALVAFHEPAAVTTISYATRPTSVTAGVDRRGVAGSSFDFNGVDGQIEYDDPRLPLGSTPRTLSVWFRTSEATGAHTIVNWGNATRGERFGLLVDAGRVKLVGEFQDLMSGHTFADGRWHHAAATFDGTHGAVWVDGVRLAAGPLALNTSGSTVVMGNAPSNHPPEWWRGSIADARVYSRALSPSELTAIARQ